MELSRQSLSSRGELLDRKRLKSRGKWKNRRELLRTKDKMSGHCEPIPRLISSKQAARLLGVAEGTLRYWRAMNVGPPWVKLRRRALYDVADLVEFIARGRRNPSVRTREVDDVSI